MDGAIAYDAFVAKIRVLAGNKVAMMTKPTPMDIGYAATADGGGDSSEQNVQPVHGVAAVWGHGRGKRWTCVDQGLVFCLWETGHRVDESTERAANSEDESGLLQRQ